jgi:hypothetical protein
MVKIYHHDCLSTLTDSITFSQPKIKMDKHGLNKTNNVHVNVTMRGVGVTTVAVEMQ